MKTMSLKNILAISAVSAAAGLTSLNAGAGEIEETLAHPLSIETQTVTVEYDQMELATEEGREAVEFRISKAAREVCGPSSVKEAGDLEFATRNRQCYRDAVSAAHSQLETAAAAVTGR